MYEAFDIIKPLSMVIFRRTQASCINSLRSNVFLLNMHSARKAGENQNQTSQSSYTDLISHWPDIAPVL